MYQEEVAGDTMLPLLPHGRADARRHRSSTHDEEGAGQKISWQRLGRAGEVRRGAVRCRRLIESAGKSLLASE